MGKTAEQIMINFAETSHPIFRATSALEKGESRSKTNGEKSIHFNGSKGNIDLLLRMVISANQLSVYGAVDSNDQKLSKLCSDAGLKINERGHFFITLDTEEEPK